MSVTTITKTTVTLADGTTITFDILIGCDGVKSVVARYLFGRSFTPKTIDFGLEVEAPLRENQSVEIDFGVADWGYTWAFPKAKSMTIGVGGFHAKNSDLKERFHELKILIQAIAESKANTSPLVITVARRAVATSSFAAMPLALLIPYQAKELVMQFKAGHALPVL